MLTGQSEGGSYSIEVASSQVTLAWLKETCQYISQTPNLPALGTGIY